MARRRMLGVVGTTMLAVAVLLGTAMSPGGAETTAGPNNLAAVSPTKSIKLTWRSGPEKTNVVERAPGADADAEDFAAVKTLSNKKPSSKSWEDKTVTLGQTYTYRIKGYTGTGPALYSDPVTVRSGPAAAAAPTTNTTATTTTTSTTTTTAPPTGATNTWVNYGGTSQDTAIAVATDAAGNSAIAAKVSGKVRIGTTDIGTATTATEFIARYNASGGNEWAKPVPATTVDLVLDANGNVVVLTMASSGAMQLTKYSPNGSAAAPNTYGSSGLSPSAIDVNANGSMVVTGRAMPSARIGTFDLSGSSQNPFYAVFDAQGTLKTAKRITGTNGFYGYGTGVAIDDDGDVAVTGAYFGTLNVTGNMPVAAGSGTYDEDGFVAYFPATTSSRVWSARFGDLKTDGGASVDFAPNGDLVLAGQFHGTINFTTDSGDQLVSPKTQGLFEVNPFLARFRTTSTGLTHVWSDEYTAGTAALGQGGAATEVVTTRDDSILLAGTLVEAINFGSRPEDALTALTRTHDAYVVKFRGDGTHVWSKRFGSVTAIDRSEGVAATPQNGAVTIGSLYGVAGVLSFGQEDVYVGRLAP